VVEQLFLKSLTDSALFETDSYDVSKRGIEASRPQHPLKQLLLLPQGSLRAFSLRPGQLKEDMVLNTPFDFHGLASGTVIRIGSAELRLTFHCEPCAKIKHLVNPKKIVHQRGYHSQIVRAGRIQLGDKVTVLSQDYEPIPYALADRIKWYLAHHPVPIYAKDLVEAIGLSSSYCRAVPNVIKHREDIDKQLILYKNKQV
jgi:MOSC domain-containing protein YiiM